MNRGLAGEVARMALDTVRGNKLRSALTILGVVIGITSIVGDDVAHPRLRHVAARQRPAARARHGLPDAN